MNALRNPSFQEASLPTWSQLIDAEREHLFPKSQYVPGEVREAIWEDVLLAPVRDILSRPGKSVRAALVQAGYAFVRPGETVPSPASALVEILHAGSLIVDDIEDDAKVRRGGKAIHRVFGVPRALNAGNWMYFLALYQIETLGLDETLKSELYQLVNQTLLACHRGQALDVGLRIGEVSKEELPALVTEISLLKTGSLTALALSLGARLAGGSPEQVSHAHRFGTELGLALQQLDDMGNLTAKSAGKKLHEDLYNGCLSWPWAWAAQSLGTLEFAQLEKACRFLREEGQGLRPNSKALARRLAEVAGPHKRRFILHRLHQLLTDLAQHFPDGAGVQLLKEQVQCLEASYV
jgi:geranylgeranyl pyrophosphate synthase